MPPKSPIDIQRDGAITLHVGGDDKSTITEYLSTSSGLYVIKEMGVYKIQLADDIDPDRKNPNIPNLNQQVLAVGCQNETVAKVLLTAKWLFDERNATVNPFTSELFEICLGLTRQILELEKMTSQLIDEINEKEKVFSEGTMMPNAAIIPSILNIDTKLHNILSQLDKAKDAILAICSLQFLPGNHGKPKLQDLKKSIDENLSENPQLIAAWDKISEYLTLVRNMRNGIEHPKKGERVALSNFTLQADGKLYPPLIEVQHPKTRIRTLPLAEFLEFIRKTILEHAELILAFIRMSKLLKNNPFEEAVVEFPDEERRHKFVRYYRAVNFGGNWRILG